MVETYLIITVVGMIFSRVERLSNDMLLMYLSWAVLLCLFPIVYDILCYFFVFDFFYPQLSAHERLVGHERARLTERVHRRRPRAADS